MREGILKRSPRNPIIKEDDLTGFGARYCYNPGSAFANGGVALLVRIHGEDKASRLVVARSKDGETIDSIDECPAFAPSYDEDRLGVEDPRITTYSAKELDGIISGNGYEKAHLITFTGFKDNSQGFDTRIGIAYTDDFKNFTRLGFARFPDGYNNAKNGVLFPEKINGRYAMLYRPKTKEDVWGIRLAYSNNLLQWEDAGVVISPFAEWCIRRVGAAAPPILVKNERPHWLASFHGADAENRYSIGFAMLDYNDPSKVSSITPQPVHQPQEPYETEGLVPKVVFLTGLLQQGDSLLAHWGCADKYVASGNYSLPALMGYLEEKESRTAAETVKS